MLTNLALLASLIAPARDLDRPRVELWTSRGDAAYTRGQPVRVYFRLDRDAFVTVFRVDTDGRVRVLFPREPWEDNFAHGGREFEVEGHSNSDAFFIDDYPGVGYLFAVASEDRFVYDAIAGGDHWDYRAISDGRVRGDPYVALTDLARQIVPQSYEAWDYDIVPYYVERHYDYPRFLCYDCHSYVSWAYWDPYHYSCVRFRIVVFDDPYYYPYRYYGGTRVVFARPYRPQPRFIFKDWGAQQPTRDGFVTRDRERPVNDNTRRGVTARDIGGIGIIPAPVERDRRARPSHDGRPDKPGDDRGRRERPEHPDHPDHPDRPEHPEHPDHPDRPDNRDNRDRRGRPDRPDRGDVYRPQIIAPRPDSRAEPRSEPRRESPRTEPQAEPRRESPRAEPRAEPRREPARAEPRSQPSRAEPKRDAPSSKPQRSEPELRRRKP